MHDALQGPISIRWKWSAFTTPAFAPLPLRELHHYCDPVCRLCLFPSREMPLPLSRFDRFGTDFTCSVKQPAFGSCQHKPGCRVARLQISCYTLLWGVFVTTAFRHWLRQLKRLNRWFTFVQLPSAHLPESRFDSSFSLTTIPLPGYAAKGGLETTSECPLREAFPASLLPPSAGHSLRLSSALFRGKGPPGFHLLYSIPLLSFDGKGGQVTHVWQPHAYGDFSTELH